MSASVTSGQIKRLLTNRNFVLIWWAYAISALGDHLSEMALLKTQDALNPNVDITPLSARMSFMFFTPFVLLAPFAGVLADRLPRRALMVFADGARFAILLVFASLIAWMQNWSSWGVFLPLLLVGTFAAIFSPARSALLPTLVDPDQLVTANGMISGLGIIATMAAALIGGYLADHFPPVVAFRIDSLTFAASALFLLLLRPPRRTSFDARVGSGRSGWSALRAGLHYARSHRRVLELFAVAALVWFCGSLVNSVIPAVVRDAYAGDYQLISSYRALLGVGFVVGAAAITVLGDALRPEIAMTWGLFGIAGGMTVFAASASLHLNSASLARIGAVGVVLGGASAVAVMASFTTLLQRTTADRFRGRVFGVNDLCCTTALLAATGLLALPQWTRVDRFVGLILASVAIVTFGAAVVTLIVRLNRGPLGAALTFAENLNELLAKTFWRLRLVGPSTVPHQGPVIIAANHTCSADPLLLCACVMYRPIAFMVAREYSNWPIVRFFLRLVECIPVSRTGQDTAGFKAAIRHLRAGKAIGVFIEGRIVPPGETGDPKDGAAMLALMTGAAVVPAHISGTKYHDRVLRGLFSRHRARVRFGRPVDLSEFQGDRGNRETTHSATLKIHRAIQALAENP